MITADLLKISILLKKYNELTKSANDGDTFKTILLHLGINECVLDVFALLCSDVSFKSMLDTLGIERSLAICDELCAPSIITKILQHAPTLHNMSQTHIINCNDQPISLYNKGYMPISTNGMWHIPLTIIDYDLNNAYDNGLYTNNIHIGLNRNIYACRCEYLKEIDTIELSRDYNNGENVGNSGVQYIIKNCSNIKHIYGNICGSTIFDQTFTYSAELETLWLTECPICDQYLKPCIKLRELYIPGGSTNITCEHFALTLRKLHIAQNVANNMFNTDLCINLKILIACNNHYITTCDPFAKTLIVLNISGKSSEMSDSGIKLCTRLKKLNASYNTHITTCTPFAKTLKVLMAAGTCGINNDGLTSCTHLKYLDINSNQNITTCLPFAKSLRYISVFSIHHIAGINRLKNGCCIREFPARQNFSADFNCLKTPL